MKLWFAALLVLFNASLSAQNSFLGFDRNEYPGDANLKILKQRFSYGGYWLNNPPGASSNTWRGHRAAMQSAGFGFLVLFNGRLYAQLKNVADAQRLGKSDAASAVVSAKHEGFPEKTIIFLDQEQGGRMLPEQRAYIHAWIDGVVRVGYRAGVYCSGIPFRESAGVSVVTANDIKDHAGAREIHFFISNDQCPPAPGCVFPKSAPNPAGSGVPFADAWQFAQSPRRPEMTAACRQTYAPDGNCYAPASAKGLFLDVESANSADPSQGRGR